MGFSDKYLVIDLKYSTFTVAYIYTDQQKKWD